MTVIELSGVVGQLGPARKGLTLARVESAIESAFKPRALKAVALAINSPGGSPVQSRLIHDAIRRQAEKKKIPVYAFIEDVGASGGYILALAGDEIYADASSVVGSIGVISAGFGFHELIGRHGVERRLYTAGEHKSLLDPFRREDPTEVARLQAILDDMHAQFIDLVKARRGDRLGGQDDVFTGAFWTAGPAKERGLVDGIAHLGDLMRARFGENVKLKKVAPDRGSLLRRLMGGESRGLIDPEAVLAALEAKALWARYGR